MYEGMWFKVSTINIGATMKSSLCILIMLYPCVQAYRGVHHSTASIHLFQMGGQSKHKKVNSTHGRLTSNIARRSSFLELRKRPAIASNRILLHEQVIAPKKLGEYTRYVANPLLI